MREEARCILTPRTGTRALKRAIAERYPQSFMLYRHMEADGVPQGYDRWPKIGVVREPVARLWSLYKYLKRFGLDFCEEHDTTYTAKMRQSVERSMNAPDDLTRWPRLVQATERPLSLSRCDYEPIVSGVPGTQSPLSTVGLAVNAPDDLGRGEEPVRLMLRSSLLLMRDRAMACKNAACAPSWALLDVVERVASESALNHALEVEQLRELRRLCLNVVASASSFDTLFQPRLPGLDDGEADGRAA
jgi:hypothetical protein